MTPARSSAARAVIVAIDFPLPRTVMGVPAGGRAVCGRAVDFRRSRRQGGLRRVFPQPEIAAGHRPADVAHHHDRVVVADREAARLIVEVRVTVLAIAPDPDAIAGVLDDLDVAAMRFAVDVAGRDDRAGAVDATASTSEGEIASGVCSSIMFSSTS